MTGGGIVAGVLNPKRRGKIGSEMRSVSEVDIRE